MEILDSNLFQHPALLVLPMKFRYNKKALRRDCWLIFHFEFLRTTIHKGSLYVL
jgi:hypothetical protein